jgi:flavodoxin
MKRLPLLASLALIAAAVSVLALAAGEPAAAPDVLIIHAAGTPFEAFANLTPENVDAVSCPTPVALNCKTLAEQAAEALRAKGLAVRIAETADITHRRQLLEPRLVVLASPTYFGTCSWRMHRLIQEPLWQVFALGGEKLDGKRFAFMATARNEGNGKGCIEAMQGAVKSCNATPGPAMGVAIDAAPDKVKERIAKFADEVAAQLKEAK